MGAESAHFIATLLVFNTLSPGRALFGLKGVEAAATDAERAIIGQALNAARIQGRTVARINRAWRRVRKLTGGRPGIQALDGRVDTVLASIYAPLDRAASKLPEGHPLRTQAEALLKLHFPDGLGAVTRLPYEEELDEAEDLHATLSGEAYAHLVSQLGLGIWLEQLGTLLPEYDAATRTEAGRPLTFAEVRAARIELREAVARLRAIVLGHWPWPEDAPTRTRLLAPLQRQSDAVSEAARRQVRPQDVHPDTGNEVESEEEDDGPDPS